MENNQGFISIKKNYFNPHIFIETETINKHTHTQKKNVIKLKSARGKKKKENE